MYWNLWMRSRTNDHCFNKSSTVSSKHQRRALEMVGVGLVRRQPEVLRPLPRSFGQGSEQRVLVKEWVLYSFPSKYLADPVVIICETMTEEVGRTGTLSEMLGFAPINYNWRAIELQSSISVYGEQLSWFYIKQCLILHLPTRNGLHYMTWMKSPEKDNLQQQQISKSKQKE